MALKRPFSELDWQLTPEPVRQYIMALERTLFDMEQRIAAHEQRLEKLEVRTRKNSHNSSKPPSSDPPFNRKKRKQKKSKRSKGGQKGHKANQQQMLNPTESHWLMPNAAHAGIRRSIPNRCSRFTCISISNSQNRNGNQPLYSPAMRLSQLRQGRSRPRCLGRRPPVTGLALPPLSGN
jgi:hypothetical protein